MSSSPSDSLIGSPYDLLQGYAHQAKVKAKAYSYSDNYFRLLHKQLTYPLVVLSAVSSVIAVLDVNKYALIGLNLSILILVGFNQVINPKDKSNEAHNISMEFNEINGNISQFIKSNHRTLAEVKSYGEMIHSELNIWSSLAPQIKESFLIKATLLYANRARKSRRVIEKNASQLNVVIP